MTKYLLTICVSIFSIGVAISQNSTATPQIASYNEVVSLIHQLDEKSESVSAVCIGKSALNKDIYALTYSKGIFGEDKSKLKVLIFAQQHGNEQSGKEGALAIAKSLLTKENEGLLNRLDIAIIPQINPDGGDKNTRRNGNNVDMNRNHLIMTEPEVQVLHNFFDKYLFDVTIDMHEYFTYGESWKAVGFRRNSDVLLGLLTNPAVPKEIRDFQMQKFYKPYNKVLNQLGIKNGLYTPGGPTAADYYRYSTFDINDGRQSFGVQGTFSFIQEGMNGKDYFAENIHFRTYAQQQGVLSLLKSCFQHSKAIRKMVSKERANLTSNANLTHIPLIMEHQPNGSTLRVSVRSYKTDSDSSVVITDFRPVVATRYAIEKPMGYLIPKSDSKLMKWVERQNFTASTLSPHSNFIFEQSHIERIDSIDFEGDIIASPVLSTRQLTALDSLDAYIYIPTNQIKSNILIMGVEPKSEIGIATYPLFAYLMQINSTYPVIRVIKGRK